MVENYGNPNDPTSQNYVPDNPSGLELIHTDSKSLNLKWNDNSLGEENFIIEGRNVSNSDSNFSVYQILGENETGFAINSIDTNSIYEFRVKAKSGNYFSDFSNTIKVGYGKYLLENGIKDIHVESSDASFYFSKYDDKYFIRSSKRLYAYQNNELSYLTTLDDYNITFGEKGDIFATVYLHVNIHKTINGEKIKSLEQFDGIVSSLVFSPDETKFLAKVKVGNDNMIYLYDITNDIVLWKENVKNYDYFQMGYIDNDIFYLYDSSTKVITLRTMNNEVIQEIKLGDFISDLIAERIYGIDNNKLIINTGNEYGTYRLSIFDYYLNKVVYQSAIGQDYAHWKISYVKNLNKIYFTNLMYEFPNSKLNIIEFDIDNLQSKLKAVLPSSNYPTVYANYDFSRIALKEDFNFKIYTLLDGWDYR